MPAVSFRPEDTDNPAKRKQEADMSCMQRAWSLLILVLIGAGATAQEPLTPAAAPLSTAVWPGETASATPMTMPDDGSVGSRLAGNHAFPTFIGFISNPLQNIDPRAVTELYPVFGSAWTSEAGPVSSSDAQLYGAGLTIALSDRLAVGLNQGGYADVHLSTRDAGLLAVVAQLGRQKVLNLLSQNPAALLALLRQHGLGTKDFLELKRLASFDPSGQFTDVEAGGDRSGWLNLGGFAQYTLIEDAASQFLLTAGLRVEAPCGSHDIFQGHGPAHLAPYLTAGQGIGEFHVLATTGYYFPAGPGSDTSQLFYADLHVDRRCFGWLYPLVEFNFDYHTTNVSLDLPARRGFFNLDNFEASGNILTMAVGANAVLIPEKLEVGAVYLTSLAVQRDFAVNGLMVKVVYRY
jgi:hypothetical protein